MNLAGDNGTNWAATGMEGRRGELLLIKELDELYMKFVWGIIFEFGLVVMGEGERTGLLGCSCIITPGFDV